MHELQDEKRTSDQTSLQLLTPAQMGQADRAAIASGIPGIDLMAKAGEAVALAVARRWQPCRVAVLCGPGNNGGDGFVAAQWLRERGWPVRLFLLGQVQDLRGDAAWAAGIWQGECEAAQAFDSTDCDLIIDALFGAGLCRPLEGESAALVEALNTSGLPVCAVDVPSGLDGATGLPAMSAESGEPAPVVQAALTVTFFRTKPGHWLMPGRALSGEVVLADIGIPADVLPGIDPPPAVWRNAPALWRAALPRSTATSHKYHRGHALVWGGAALTGAARLAAQAAQRAGAGLVTVAAPAAVWSVYAQSLQGCMVQAMTEEEGGGFASLLADARRNACLIGPGAGVDAHTRAAVLAAAQAGKALVLDADALTVFSPEEGQGGPAALFAALKTLDDCLDGCGATAILTPHEGEFARLFGADHAVKKAGQSKLARALAAARSSGAVVVLKGADTVIAAPDGRAAINANAPAALATGGTGDVLAGIAVALLAQGMPAFEAACAAVWLHGRAAQGWCDAHGPALVAEDLLHSLPAAMQTVWRC